MPEPVEPVSIDDARAYLRVLHTDEDDKITGMIVRAREWVEDHTGLALVRREFVETRLPERGAIALYKGPVVSAQAFHGDPEEELEGVRFIPGPVTLLYPPSEGYWPTLRHPARFTVRYVAGYAEGEVPERLVGAVLALVEGEFSDGFAYPARAVAAAERCCGQLRATVIA